MQRLGLMVSPALRKVLERADADSLNGYFSIPGKGAHHVTLHHFMRIVRRLLQLYREGVRPEDVVQLFATNQQYEDSLLPSDDENSSAGEGDSEQKTEKDTFDYNDDFVEESDDNQQRAAKVLAASRGTRMAQRRAASASHPDKPVVQHQKSLKNVTSKIAPVVAHDRKRYQQSTARTNKDALRTVAQRRVDALTSTAAPLGFKDRHYFTEPRLFHSKPTTRSGDLASAVLHRSAPTVHNPDFKRYSDLGTGMATMEIADAFLQGDVGREILSTTESDYRSFPGDDPYRNISSAQRTAEVLFGAPPHSSSSSSSSHPCGYSSMEGGRASNSGEPMFPARTYPTSRSGSAGDARMAVNAQYPDATSEGAYRAHSATSVSAATHTYPGDRRLTNNNKNSNSNAGRLHNGVHPRDGSGVHISDYADSNASHRLQSTGASYAENVHSRMGASSYQQPRTIHEKRIEDKLNESAKRMYEAPGWRSAQGGWAADFGPPHTHALREGESAWRTSDYHHTSGDDGARPWRRSSEDNLRQQEQSGTGIGNAEDRMAAALDVVSSETASLHNTYLRNEAAIDSMLMHTNRHVASTSKFAAGNYSFTNSRSTPFEHHGMRSGEAAALWDQEGSVDSAVIGASASGVKYPSTYNNDASVIAQKSFDIDNGQQNRDISLPIAVDTPSSTASAGAEANDDSSSAAGGADADEHGHYNPYAYEDEGDGFSGDDAEYAVSLDGSMALSAAVL